METWVLVLLYTGAGLISLFLSIWLLNQDMSRKGNGAAFTKMTSDGDNFREDFTTGDRS